MPQNNDANAVIESWSRIPELVRESIGALEADELDLRAGTDTLSIREFVHHLTEANVVATSIVVAALGSPGCTYDWTWMQPFGPWMDRMGYADKPVEHALDTLQAVNAYVVSLIGSDIDKLERVVHLRDAPDAELRRMTVADVLMQEYTHALEHTEDICQVRERYRKSSSR